jgi:hypothetical protein
MSTINNSDIFLITRGTTNYKVTAADVKTYTAVTGTAPIAVTGSVVSLNLGLGVAANGTNLAFKMPVASTPPGIGTGATQGFDGSMYWDDTLGQLFVRYNNSSSPTWVAAAPPAGNNLYTGTAPITVSGTTIGINAASTAASGSVQLSTAAEAQAFADALKALTPSTLNQALKGSNQSLATTGYQKLPGGLILQWVAGGATYVGANGLTAGTGTWPITFPNACLAAWISFDLTFAAAYTVSSNVFSVTAANCGVVISNYGAVPLTAQGSFLIGIGY